MLKLLARIGFLILIGLACLGTWRAYTYSSLTQVYAPYVLGLLLVVLLLAGSLVMRGRTR